jgi:hypothetical protein
VVRCLRCKREGGECKFLPTRRGGNYGNAHTARKARELAERAQNAQMSQNHPNETLHRDDTREDNAQADVQQLAEVGIYISPQSLPADNTGT